MRYRNFLPQHFLSLDAHTTAVLPIILGLTSLIHTCGVAPDRVGFVATNGVGIMMGFEGSTVSEQQFGFQFDEHLRRLGV